MFSFLREGKKRVPAKKQIKKVIHKLRPIAKKKLSFQPKEQILVEKNETVAEVKDDEGDEEDEEDEEEINDELMKMKAPVKPASPGIPEFFKDYLHKKWFPKGIDLKDIGGIVTSLVKELDPEKPFVLREIYTFLGELHRLVILKLIEFIE